jgi:hypothetical protein
MSGTAEIDVLDPEWRSFESVMARRAGYFISMRRLDELSRQLAHEADEEYQRRQAAESPEERERQEQRERLRGLVIRANAMADPAEAEELWAAVDAIVFGPGAA